MATKGFKQTEIGLIPEDWKVDKFKIIGKVKSCKRIYNNQTSDFGQIPFYKIGTFGKEPGAFITQHLFDKYTRKYDFPSKGTVLISASGTIGRTVVYDGKQSYFQDSNIIWIDNDESKVSNIYLNYLIKTTNFNTEGGTIQRLYNSILQNALFICPPLSEQTAIATTLSDIDSLITSLQKLIDKKKMIKQGAMQELLTGKRRLPGFNGEWERKRINQVATITKGIGLSKSKLNIEGQYECVLYGELFTTYTETFYEIISRTNIKEGLTSEIGDVLIPGSTTTTGIDLAKASAIMKADVLLGGDINVIRNSYNIYNPVFMAYQINHVCKDQVLQRAKGITIYHLHGKDIGTMSVYIPELKEQNAISEIFNDMTFEIKSLESKLLKLKSLKQGAMQQLLTGKIRLL